METSEAVRLPVRALVASHVIPPHASGHAVVLGRLLSSIHPDDYRLVTFNDMPEQAGKVGEERALPAKTYRFSSQWYLDSSGRYPLTTVRWVRRLATEVASTAAIMAKVCADEECEAIVATTGTLPRLPAALAAARLARVPLYILMWDFWRFQEHFPLFRRLVELTEPVVVRSARAVAVPNELLADAMARVDRMRPVVIRNPIDDAALTEPRLPRVPNPNGGARIVFTGQIYAAMTDAVVNLMQALDEPGLERVEFHYYGPQTRDHLRSLGVSGRVVCHPFVSAPAIYDVQRSADILFLPLAFGGSLADIVYTSSTTKLADYLASGRPILVHMPPGAFPAWYVRRHECGLVVDSPSPQALARAIRTLLDDRDLGERLGWRGFDRARQDFSIAAARDQFIAMLHPNGGVSCA